MNNYLSNIVASILAVCMWSVSFSALPSESSEGLTEQKILTIMKAQDNALERLDAAAFLSSMADDYVYTSEKEGKASKKSRKEIEASLTKNLPKFSSYQISNENRKINISPDGRSATLTQKTNETVIMGEKVIDAISLTTRVFELRGDKVVVTSSADILQDQKVSDMPKDCTYSPVNEQVARYDVAQYHSKSTLLGLFGMTNPVPFCRMYKADAKTVSSILQGLISRLGNPIKVADVANGLFTTDIMNRSAIMAKWQDSYSITAQEESAGITVVRILRALNVYQSSQNGYEQNLSDGDNEKWMLSQITDRLASRVKDAPVPPAAGIQPVALSSASISVEAQLEKLQDMRKKNIITEQEYKSMRVKALGL
jgi:hypothetical protein